ncbi:MAG: SurA N-terminal domain-containing protein [Clostridiales bacterium]|nr:SurA N-terminal domain-containing protein [Clostridiales bacterium]
MKKSTKKTIRVAVLAVVIAAAVLGTVLLISALSRDDFGNNGFTRGRAVASVGSDRITLGEFSRSFGNYYRNIDNNNMNVLMGYGGKYYDTSREGWELELKHDVLDQLITLRLYRQKANELGLALSADQVKDAKQAGYDAIAQLEADCLASAEEAGASDPKTYAVTILNNYLRSSGLTKAQYRDEIVQNVKFSMYGELVWDYYRENNLPVADEELPALYEKFVHEYFRDGYSRGMVTTYYERFAKGESEYTYLYIPDEFIFVRAIYAGTDEENAKAILARIEGGERFDTVRASEDNLDEFLRTYAEPIAIGEEDSLIGDAAFERASEMVVGTYAIVADIRQEHVHSDDEEDHEAMDDVAHYYIIRRVTAQTGIVPFERFADALREILVGIEQNRLFEELADTWLSDESITRNERLVLSVVPPRSR